MTPYLTWNPRYVNRCSICQGLTTSLSPLPHSRLPVSAQVKSTPLNLATIPFYSTDFATLYYQLTFAVWLETWARNEDHAFGRTSAHRLFAISGEHRKEEGAPHRHQLRFTTVRSGCGILHTEDMSQRCVRLQGPARS